MPTPMIDYYGESEKYRPAAIKTLLVAEAPPPSGRSYFYLPRAMSNEIPVEKDTSLPTTIFHHFFGRRPGTVKKYVKLLSLLKSKGIFLVDILEEPVRLRGRRGIVQENLEYLISQNPSLRNRIAARGISVPDENIVFLLPRLHYLTHLRREFPRSRFVRWKDFRMERKHPQSTRRSGTRA